ncbi:hypothetical protein CC86DRAFT_377817 [Ophiobolus disseminans]|uniref:F-box domain-containing protein n=1 Tax=Ophiobolus disseminans TaxID=1469910 RepID=A0A6A7AHX2_9PLEO|nr:hypothetical protein CC86DRAFT_377817 [Ophiobolus disseminans]
MPPNTLKRKPRGRDFIAQKRRRYDVAFYGHPGPTTKFLNLPNARISYENVIGRHNSVPELNHIDYDDNDDCIITEVRSVKKPPAAPFPFLYLPPELRNYIHGIVELETTSRTLKMTCKPGRSSRPLANTYISLMYVNRQIRAEFRPIYLREQRAEIAIDQFVRYMQDFIDPHGLTKEYTHITLDTQDYTADYSLDLLALGKLAVDRRIDYFNVDPLQDKRNPVTLLNCLTVRARDWYPALQGKYIESMRLDYRANPAHPPSRHRICINFNNTGRERYSFPTRESSVKFRSDMVWSIVQSMAFDQLDERWAPVVRGEFDDGLSVFWKCDALDLWSRAVYDEPDLDVWHDGGGGCFSEACMDSRGKVWSGWMRR